VEFALYYVYTGTTFHIIKKTLEAILRKAADMLLKYTLVGEWIRGWNVY
jgi:hypothetical protein